MFSSVGRKKIAAQAVFLLVDIIVLALSATVNRFQDFFYVADLFPFALSIVSLVVVVLLLAIDLALDNAYTARPQTEIGIYGLLSIFWLSFNAFSTERWSAIPFQCNSIPTEFVDERLWCKSLQALKSFVWINFLLCLGISLFTLRYSISQYYQGNKHIFKMSFSRYRPDIQTRETSFFSGRDSEFLQHFEKLT
ncbi:hypothetical protein BDN70DRAFT_885794 [Pholiota conissans]|uniref:MARVEL domain-containing protein n=1 Tax=Pholiota conissans TaxID=109636 RepID=A0A9P6CUS5_9AGAR|nr:hypothetical protein BDN70DRAFT_885794 [Pholiota conissans]